MAPSTFTEQGRHTRLLLLVGLGFVLGCTNATTAPLDLTTLDPHQDQFRIATHYAQEATAFRLKVEEQLTRAAQYEHLFGPHSDWVTSVRLLAQFYEEAAREKEHLAAMHFNIARGKTPSR